LRFDDGVEAGIVDVPGHERFIHNMLAGAAGMELLLLVVAANDGVRPQTAEHLAILDFLNVRRAIVVLTKRDLVDDDLLAEAEREVREATRGTVAENAPVIAVSTITGEGIDLLRAAIHDALVALPPRALDAPAFLPVDRVFALAGHGTIVTGTLMQGTLRVGDTLRLDALDRAVRVRSLQVFGAARPSANGGARVALNLPGVEVTELHRGAVLADGTLGTSASLRVRFRALPEARPLLRRRTHVRAYLGAAEILATLVLERGAVAPRRRTRARHSSCARSRPKRCSAAEPSMPRPTPMPVTTSRPTSPRSLVRWRKASSFPGPRPNSARAPTFAKSEQSKSSPSWSRRAPHAACSSRRPISTGLRQTHCRLASMRFCGAARARRRGCSARRRSRWPARSAWTNRRYCGFWQPMPTTDESSLAPGTMRRSITARN
jgi:ethanolamine utilization protein EutP (predicted NTPase)